MTIVFLVMKLRWWVWDEFVVDAFGRFSRVFQFYFCFVFCWNVMWYYVTWHNLIQYMAWYLWDYVGCFWNVFACFSILCLFDHLMKCVVLRHGSILFISMRIVCFDI
jgi:hypothetical protein